jgi:hypothetical protein
MSDQPIADRLLGPEGPELGCDECFEYLDLYADAQASGDTAFETCPVCTSPNVCASARSCRAMDAHLQGCPACAEEYASLQALIAEQERM